MIDIFNKLFNKPSVWDVAVAINRSNAMPLDKNSIFPDYDLAAAYASADAVRINNELVRLNVLAADKQLTPGASGADTQAGKNLASVMFNNNAYPGQIIAVVTETETTVYYIDAAGALKEVGGKVTAQQIKDLGFLDSTETATAIATAVAEAGHAKAMIVDSVDTANKTYTIGTETKAAVPNVIYYVYVEAAKGDDKYLEYMLIGEKLVLVGSTATDLSNYYNKGEVDDLIKDFITANDIPDVSVVSVAKPDTTDGGIAVLADISATEHAITPTYEVVATLDDITSAIEAITFPGVEVSKSQTDYELEEGAQKVAVLVTLENKEDDHTIEYQTVELPTIERIEGIESRLNAIIIPTIPTISITEDTIPTVPTSADAKVENAGDEMVEIVVGKGETATTESKLGLVTVLRSLDVDTTDGHTLVEDRVQLPTVSYITKMLADVTGGESAGEVLAQLNDFKLEVGNTYLKKSDYEDTNTTYALSCLTGEENSNSVSIALTGSDSTTKSVVLKSVDENNNPTAIKVTTTADGAINITLAWEEMETLA